jgi:hypothetical protein
VSSSTQDGPSSPATPLLFLKKLFSPLSKSRSRRTSVSFNENTKLRKVDEGDDGYGDDNDDDDDDESVDRGRNFAKPANYNFSPRRSTALIVSSSVPTSSMLVGPVAASASFDSSITDDSASSSITRKRQATDDTNVVRDSSATTIDVVGASSFSSIPISQPQSFLSSTGQVLSTTTAQEFPSLL